MALDELTPGGSDCQIWFRIITVFNQDVLHAGFADNIAQIYNLVPDFLVTPARIFFLESNDQIDNFLGNLGSAG